MAGKGGLVLEMHVFGEPQLKRVLGLIVDGATDLRKAWDEVKEDFIQNEEDQFATQGGHASGGWRALSPAYAAWKAKRFPGKPILRRTDRLFQSLTRPLHEDFIFISKPDTMTIGTAVPYAVFHGRGTRRMPQRRPVELTEKQKREWPRIVHRHIFADVGEITRTPL